MKTKISRISRRTVSMVLALLMMVSILGIGSLISVSADTSVTFYVVNKCNYDGWYGDNVTYFYQENLTSGWPGDSLTDIGHFAFKGVYSMSANSYSNGVFRGSNDSVWNKSADTKIYNTGNNAPKIYIINQDGNNSTRSVTTKDAKYFLSGKINGNTNWTRTDYPLTYNNGVWSIEVTLKNNDEFKAALAYDTTYAKGASDHWCVSHGGANGNNYTVNAAGRYRISFTDATSDGTELTVTRLYQVSAGTVTNGTITPSVTYAASGETVNLTTAPNTNYNDVKPTVKDSSNASVTVDGSSNSYSFTMPAKNVTYSATFPSAAVCTPTFTVGGAAATDKTIYTDQTLVFQGVHSYAASSGTISYTVSKNSGAYSQQCLSAYSGASTNITFTPNGTGTYKIKATCSRDSKYSELTVTVNNRPQVSLVGGFRPDGWDAGGDNLMTYSVDDDCWYVEQTLDPANTYPQNGDWGFGITVVNNAGTSTFYNNSGTMASDNSTNWHFQTGKQNCGITPNYNGTYIFKVTIVNDETDDPYVTVLYPHQVSFNTDGGSSVSSQTVTYDTKATRPATDPTKDGYNFDTWVTTDGGSTPFNFNTTTITADTTVYAKWTAKQASLSFNTNGATNNGTQTVSGKATYGSAMPAFTSYTAPTKTGYTLNGWYTATSGGTKYYNADGTSANNWAVNTESTQTLYAQWTEVKAGAKVTANSNGSDDNQTGGTVKYGSNDAGASYTIPASTFGISTASAKIVAASKTHYDFTGWQFSGSNWDHLMYSFNNSTWNTPSAKDTTIGTSSNTTIYLKTDGTSGLTSSNAIVKAMFVPTTYTGIAVSAMYRESSTAAYSNPLAGAITAPASSPTSGTNKTGITVTAATKPGYKFTSWSVTGGTISSTTAQTATFKPTQNNATVTAQYERGVNVTFKEAATTPGNNGTLKAATFTYFGTKPAPDSDPSHEGWRFLGWSKDGGTTKYSTANIPNIGDDDTSAITYVAYYEEIVPEVNFTSYKTTDGTTYVAGGGELTASYTTGGGGGGGAAGNDGDYYMWHAYNEIGEDSKYTAESMTANSDGTYTASFNVAGSSTTAVFINKSGSSINTNIQSLSYADAYTDGSFNGPWSGTQQYWSNACGGNLIVLKFGKKSSGTIYVTFDPSAEVLSNNKKIYLSSSAYTPAGGGGGGAAISGDINSGDTVPYDSNVTFTAPDTYTSSGETYKFVGWYSTAQPANNETALETDTEYTVNDVIDDISVYARYNKVYSVTLYNTYYETGEGENTVFHYYSSPPNKVDITGTNGETRRLIYKNGELGSDDSPGDDRGHDKTVGFSATQYYEGNSISVCAGDTIKLSYSALASSDTITAVNYNNLCADGTTPRHYTVEGQDNDAAHDVWDYDYTSAHCLWADANYYPDDASTIDAQTYEATVDNDSHTVQWTVKGDYHNVDLEIEQKKQITFKSKTGIDITSKNTDNYYSTNEAVSAAGADTGLKVIVDTAAESSNNCTYELGTPTYFEKESGKQIVTVMPSPLPEGKTAADYYVDAAFTISYNSSTHKFTGNMPNYDVVIDMNVTTKFTAKIGSWMLSDPINGGTAGFNKWNKIASVTGTISSGGSQSDAQYDVADNARASQDEKTIVKGTQITYSSVYYTEDSNHTPQDYEHQYLFVGWYKGTSSGPDMQNGFLSKDMTYNYTPKQNVHIWAVGTRMMYIGGNFYINDGEQTYVADDNDNATWASNRQHMVWNAAAGCYSYTFNTVSYTDAYHFRVYETASSADGDSDATIWNRWGSAHNTKYNNTFDGNTHTLNYGRYYLDNTDTGTSSWNNCGWFSVNSTVTDGGYDAPVTVYFYPADGGITVSATYKWKKAYVSSGMNGFDSSTGTKITNDTSNTTSAPNKTCTVTGQSGTIVTTDSEINKHWNPTGSYTSELNVTEYYVKTKDGTIRVTKDVASGYKVDAFVIYCYDKKENKVSSVKAKAGTTANSYYADIQVSDNCYIYPVLSKTSANLTVRVNYKDLDKTKWGDLISLYAWDTTTPTAKNLNGVFPGQLMIPSSDGETWWATVDSTNLDGITFANHYGGTWIDNQLQSQTVFSTYNTIGGGNNKVVQTYDYREPKALLDTSNTETGEHTIISFTLKDGNTDLTSYNGVDGSGNGTVNSSFYSTFYEKSINTDSYNFEYLTNRDGSKHVDLNGADVDGEPTASFYVICKGNNNYVNGVNQSKTAIDYSDINSYTGHWSVDWFVYDAEGNYITSVLSAAYADRVDNTYEGLTRVAEKVKDLGYAYENRSVAISYDYPYGYESGSKYRYSGQWISTSTSEKIRMNAKVAMKTGEDEDGAVIVPYDSNEVSGVGKATATYTGSKTATTGPNNAYVEIKLSEATKNPVKLSATEQNFLGWYMYDEDTETWSEVPGSSREFNPNFGKNTTMYAVYEAKATYRFKYTGRQADESGSYYKYYSVASSLNLTPEEILNSNTPSKFTEIDQEGTTRLEEAAALAPSDSDIAVYKKSVTVSINNATSCAATAYTLTFDCTTLPESYTLTYNYYKGTGGTNWGSATATGVYNEGIDISQEIKTQVVQNAPSGKKFVGWYDARNGGKLLSKQANFGMSLSEDTTIHAHYENLNYTSTYDATPLCEENTLSKELYGPTNGNYYNDFLCRFQKSDGTPQTASNCGILIIYQDDVSATFNGSQITQANYTTALNKINRVSGKAVKSTAKNSILLNIKANELSVFSRVDLVFKSAYSEYRNRKYFAVPYVYENGNYTYGDPIDEKTYN